MTVVGLITEYNPFHNGHAYHLAQAKKITGADTAIAVMSGNFVQRGMPANFDKWRRAETAILNGVDLVIELPFAFAVQPGHIFAKGAVNILANVGVDVIVCGAEHAEWDFIALAKIAQQATHDNDVFHDYQNTYASTYSAILKAETGLVVDHPNDLLALSYAMAIVTLGLVNDIRIQPIQRRTAAYHETQLGSDAIASATAIRQALTNGETKQVQVHVPTATKKMIAAGLQIAAPESQLWSLLKYKVVTTPIDELERLYQLNNGLAYRLKMQVEHAMVDPTMTWTTFLKQFKSKRYTLSRIQRSLLYTLLNITTDEMLYAENHLYIRVLGSNQTGRRHLKQQRDTIELPMIHHVDQKKLQTILKLDYRAGHLYEWLTTTDKQALRQDTGRIPFML